ncbi:hypothetical protein DFP72DRAFT_828953, partial [Ephemerocybe angulata]
KSKTILVVLVPQLDDPAYVSSVIRATETILREGEDAQFTPEELEHRRASESAALNVGPYYGGGATEPGNIRNGRHTAMLERLVADPDITRMASFADATFKLWAPRVYSDVEKKMRALHRHKPSLKKNWESNVYPCAAFNFGPRVACKMHKDSGNAPHTFCAIQALGTFDATKGGHLAIKELRIHIRFPSGSTIYISSALFTHGNTPVAAHETRLSITQFVPGGLIRYVDNGFNTEDGLRKKNKRLWREKMAEKATRWERAGALLSTLDELTQRDIPPHML